MDRRTKFSLLAIGILLASTLGILVAVSASPLDPLAEFRQADGSVMIPGDRFTPELQKLLFPAEPAKSYWTYATARSAYPTLAVLGEEHEIARVPARSVQGLKPLGTDSLNVFFDALLRLPASIVSFFESVSPIGTAAAVDRFAVFDDAQCTATTISTDADCWTTPVTNGDGNGLPVAGDNLVFDNGSGAVSGTMDASLSITTGTITFCSAAAAPIAGCGGAWANTLALATFTLTNTGTIAFDGGTITSGVGGGIDGGAMTMSAAAPTATVTMTGASTWRLNGLTINDGGTLTAGAGSTVTMDGNWNSSAVGSVFTPSTGTVVFAVSASISTLASNGGSTFYNLTINDTFTGTVGNSIGVGNILTVNGTLTDNAVSIIIYMRDESGSATPLVFDADGVITATATDRIDIDWFLQAGTGITVPAKTYANVRMSWEPVLGLAFPGVLYTLAGNVSMASWRFHDYTAASHYRVVTGTFNVTLTNSMFGSASGAAQRHGIASTSGTWSLGGVAFANANSFYWQMGSITATVTGGCGGGCAYRQGSTNGADWDAGTATITMTMDGGVFRPASLGENEFATLTLNSANAAGQTYTFETNGMRAGALTIADGTGTTTLNTDAAGNFPIIVTNAITVNTGGVLAANTSDLTFDTLDVNATMTMDGITITSAMFDTSAGSITLTLWNAHTPSSSSTASRWNFNPNTAGATVTMEFGGVQANNTYRLLRDGSTIVTEQSTGAGVVTFAVAAGWSAHDMVVERVSIPGGGGGDQGPPTDQPVVVPGAPSEIPLINIALFLIVIGALALAAGFGVRSGGLKVWGVVFIAGGVLLILYVYGYL